MTARDVQRSRVYAAETVVRRALDRAASGAGTVTMLGSTVVLPVERRFGSVDAVQRYVEGVLALRWVRATWPGRAAIAVSVRPRRGQARAEYARASATIALPPRAGNAAWALRELVVLHELAHHLAEDEHEEPHGPGFLDRLLALVEGVIGPEAGLLLRATLHNAGARLSLAATS
ncbi:MAG: TIGR04338 family metallohydrolase [Jatrophihabitans sp.]|nr:MAG: TIGR04338 family metallohydrolase [Jatrophihabitans sp.]